MEVKLKSPCHGCEDRHAGCHGKCEAYASFVESKDADFQKRIASEDYGVYAGYTRAKKSEAFDKAAKEGRLTTNYQKARYR